MPQVLVDGPGRWLLEGALPQWPRPPDPRPEVSLVAWGRAGRLWSCYLAWTDVDSWQARSRGGRLVPQVLYTRWVLADRLRPVPGCDYRGVPRLRLDGEPGSWPSPAVAPDGTPWFGEHRVYPPAVMPDPVP